MIKACRACAKACGDRHRQRRVHAEDAARASKTRPPRYWTAAALALHLRANKVDDRTVARFSRTTGAALVAACDGDGAEADAVGALMDARGVPPGFRERRAVRAALDQVLALHRAHCKKLADRKGLPVNEWTAEQLLQQVREEFGGGLLDARTATKVTTAFERAGVTGADLATAAEPEAVLRDLGLNSIKSEALHQVADACRAWLDQAARYGIALHQARMRRLRRTESRLDQEHSKAVGAARAKLRKLTAAAATPLKELYDHLDYAFALGVAPDDADAAAARRRAEELRAAASGRVDAPMPDGALRRFVQFAKRPELAADYHFANRAQQELPETAALERECPHLAARVDAAIAAELAVGADTFREVSAQATAFFAGVYESIFATVAESERDAKARYDAAVRSFPGAATPIRQRATRVVPLLVDAAAAAPAFDAAVGALVSAATAAGRRVERKRPPLKSASRIVEKCALQPAAPRDTSRVCDVVRDMIICDTLEDIVDVVGRLEASTAFRIVRVKDRINHPPPSKWRDVMVNLVLRAVRTEHVCELQLCHRKMLTGREGLDGHALYNRQRCADELLEKLGGRTYPADGTNADDDQAHVAAFLFDAGAPLSGVSAPTADDEALARQLAAEDQYQLAVSSRPSAQLAASFEEEGSSAGPLVPPTSAAEEEAMVERALALAAAAAAEEEAMVERALAESWRDAA